MKKIFIEDSRVDSFLIDLCSRLEASTLDSSGNVIPNLTIVGIGESGTLIAGKLTSSVSFKRAKIANNCKGISVQQDSAGVLMAVLSEENIVPLDDYLRSLEGDQGFLLLDGVCRSGKTLTTIYDRLRRVSNKVWTYAVAVSIDSTIFPTWYGCLYEGHEYVVLTRQGSTPNTALYSSSSSQLNERLATPALVLRPPLPGDPDFIAGANPSINRYTSEDRFFDSTTRAKNILVLEWDSQPVGFIAFHVELKTVWIDYIVACQSSQHTSKQGVGTALYYHVENFAKLRGCENISLWAIENKVKWYEKRGFSKTSEKSIEIGTDSKEVYYPMTHRLVSETGQYHI